VDEGIATFVLSLRLRFELLFKLCANCCISAWDNVVSTRRLDIDVSEQWRLAVSRRHWSAPTTTAADAVQSPGLPRDSVSASSWWRHDVLEQQLSADAILRAPAAGVTASSDRVCGRRCWVARWRRWCVRVHGLYKAV